MSKSSYFRNLLFKKNSSNKSQKNNQIKNPNPKEKELNPQESWLNNLATDPSNGEYLDDYIKNCNELSVEGIREFYVTPITFKLAGNTSDIDVAKRSFLHDKAANEETDELSTIVETLDPLVLLEIFKKEKPGQDVENVGYRLSYILVNQKNIGSGTIDKKLGTIFNIIMNRTLSNNSPFKNKAKGLSLLNQIFIKLEEALDQNNSQDQIQNLLESHSILMQEFINHENGKGYEKTFMERIGVSSITSIFDLKPFSGLIGLGNDLLNVRKNIKDHIDTGSEYKSHYFRYSYKKFAPNGVLKNVTRVNNFKKKLEKFEEILKSSNNILSKEILIKTVESIKERLSKSNNVDENSNSNGDVKSIKNLLTSIQEELEFDFNLRNLIKETKEELNSPDNKRKIEKFTTQTKNSSTSYARKKQLPDLPPEDKEPKEQETQKNHKELQCETEFDLTEEAKKLGEEKLREEIAKKLGEEKLMEEIAKKLEEEKLKEEMQLVENFNTAWDKYKKHEVKGSNWQNGFKTSWDHTKFTKEQKDDRKGTGKKQGVKIEVEGFSELKKCMEELGNVKNTEGETLKQSYAEIFNDQCKNDQTALKYQKTFNKIIGFSEKITKELKSHKFSEKVVEAYVKARKDFAEAGVKIGLIDEEEKSETRNH